MSDKDRVVVEIRIPHAMPTGLLSLNEKITRLETEAVTAQRLASFWRKQIDTYGETKATAFYTSLGLNHLETKSVEWEGLMLSREPNEAEKRCVKSIAQAQEASQQSVTNILLKLRDVLVDAGVKAVAKLKPSEYHLLVLKTPKENRSSLRTELESVFMRGKELVAAELGAQKSVKQAQPSDEDLEELDDLTDLTDSRVANEVQSRITAAAGRYALLGLTGAALWEAVRSEINAGSVSYIDRASRGVANKVLNFGRYREMQERSDEIDRYEYSAILDQNTCGPCAQDDGKEASSPDDLPDTPNPDCEGSDFCRCFIVTILDTVA